MTILTQKAKMIITKNEGKEITAISFAIGLCGARIRIGTDFVDGYAWGVGDTCRQYLELKKLTYQSVYCTTAHLKSAVSELGSYIKTRGLDPYTRCITDTEDVNTVSDWACKCEENDSIIVKLIECVLRHERYDDDDDDETLFDVSEVHDARVSIATGGKKSLAEILVGAWQSL